MNKIDVYIVVALAAVGIVIYLDTKAGVKAAANAVNPANNDNVVNRAANAIVGKDNKSSSIGSAIYDFFNPAYGSYDPNARPVKITGAVK